MTCICARHSGLGSGNLTFQSVSLKLHRSPNLKKSEILSSWFLRDILSCVGSCKMYTSWNPRAAMVYGASMTTASWAIFLAVDSFVVRVNILAMQIYVN